MIAVRRHLRCGERSAADRGRRRLGHDADRARVRIFASEACSRPSHRSASSWAGRRRSGCCGSGSGSGSLKMFWTLACMPSMLPSGTRCAGREVVLVQPIGVDPRRDLREIREVVAREGHEQVLLRRVEQARDVRQQRDRVELLADRLEHELLPALALVVGVLVARAGVGQRVLRIEELAALLEVDGIELLLRVVVGVVETAVRECRARCRRRAGWRRCRRSP